MLDFASNQIVKDLCDPSGHPFFEEGTSDATRTASKAVSARTAPGAFKYMRPDPCSGKKRYSDRKTWEKLKRTTQEGRLNASLSPLLPFPTVLASHQSIKPIPDWQEEPPEFSSRVSIHRVYRTTQRLASKTANFLATGLFSAMCDLFAVGSLLDYQTHAPRATIAAQISDAE